MLRKLCNCTTPATSSYVENGTGNPEETMFSLPAVSHKHCNRNICWGVICPASSSSYTNLTWCPVDCVFSRTPLLTWFLWFQALNQPWDKYHRPSICGPPGVLGGNLLGGRTGILSWQMYVTWPIISSLWSVYILIYMNGVKMFRIYCSMLARMESVSFTFIRGPSLEYWGVGFF